VRTAFASPRPAARRHPPAPGCRQFWINDAIARAVIVCLTSICSARASPPSHPQLRRTHHLPHPSSSHTHIVSGPGGISQAPYSARLWLRSFSYLGSRARRVWLPPWRKHGPRDRETFIRCAQGRGQRTAVAPRPLAAPARSLAHCRLVIPRCAAPLIVHCVVESACAFAGSWGAESTGRG